MGKVSDLSPITVGRISGMLEAQNMSQYQIARIVGVSRSSVQRIKQKVDLGEDLRAKRKGACGRRRITTERSDRKIRNICVENRKLPIKLLAKKVFEAGIEVSQRTVQRRLAEEGLIGRRPARKPRLTPAMISKRYQWAQKYKDFTIDDWKKVNYCYITIFKLFLYCSYCLV